MLRAVKKRRTASRFKLLDLSHRQIGYRLAYLRKCHDVTQAVCAKKIGLTIAQLGNVEVGRVQLKTEAAWAICNLFGVHPAWLAFGRSRESLYDLQSQSGEFLERASKADREVSFVDFWTKVSWQVREIRRQEGDESKFYIDNVNRVDSVDAVKKKELPTWDQLKKEIVRLTGKRGQKAALAGEMKISRQVLNNWLSDEGHGAPSASQTLLLLKKFWR